ncbi:MAG: hypothetical protein IT545_12945 [Rhodobacteraceae bacterium]|nr:hypothetical protein [Paracoccaceae bacterium]
MRRALGAGAAYGAAIFALGVVLGTVRVLVLAPRVGALGAVAVELPVMLGASWLAAGALARRFGVPARAGARAAMGAAGFVLLIAAEVALGRSLGQDPARQAAALATAAGAAGLAGQVAFALIPLARLARDRGR